MICINIYGGLGNQMFQYACGRALALRHKTSLVFTFPSLTKHSISTTKRSFELDVFNLKLLEANTTQLKYLRPLYYRVLNAMCFKFGLNGIQNSNYFIERKFSYNSNINEVSKNCFLHGYWQSPKYFNSYESVIRNDFTFRNQLVGNNLQILEQIRNTNSVSVHIRRTDFLTSSNINIHGICSLEYYESAVNIISEKIINPHFFIFSDDILWAIENIKLPHQFTFVSNNSDSKAHIDLQLMSSCKHNIIANSSFSWWGAWLNENPNKIIIAPSNWFLDKKLNDQTIDLIPNSWIRL